MCIKSFRELKNTGTLAEDVMYIMYNGFKVPKF
jgi:hypothetical protein